MPYPRESIEYLRREAYNQCDITLTHISEGKLEGHSVTTHHLIDRIDGYPTDGMLIESTCHELIHKLAKKPREIMNISLDAMRMTLYGIASSALSNNNYSDHLRYWLTRQYDRIEEMQYPPPTASPMTEQEIKKVKLYYINKK